MARTLTTAEKLDWLQLCRSGGVGPRTFQKLLQRFGSARRAFEELPRLAREAGHEDGEERWRRCRRDEAEAELAALAQLGGALLAWGEPGYPPRLAEIADPPPLLSVSGRVDLLEGPAIALVGARNASANGRMLARSLASDLAAGGLVVISGLARGIDTAAHEGALAAGGATVAVIASGLDVPYPEDNAELMARIAVSGAVVTERPLGAVPQARHFPRRNRLIAGLCARRRRGRGGAAVGLADHRAPCRRAGPRGHGGARQPARPAPPRHQPAAARRRHPGRDRRRRPERARPARRRPQAVAGAPGPAPCAGSRSAAPAAPGGHAPAAGDLLDRVQERLGPEPLLVDELIRQCHASTAEVQRALLELELDGRLERHPGNRVSLASA